MVSSNRSSHTRAVGAATCFTLTTLPEARGHAWFTVDHDDSDNVHSVGVSVRFAKSSLIHQIRNVTVLHLSVLCWVSTEIGFRDHPADRQLIL